MIDTEPVVLIVKSITNAMRGQKLLEQNGISSHITRNPNPNSRQGCGYVIKVSAIDAQKAVDLLAGAGILITEMRGVQHDLF